MIGIADAFAPSYARARVKFLEAAATAGAAIATHPRYLSGIDAEVLALDTALCAPKGATRLLIVSSGCHGIEGYGGSGVQVFALHDAEWREKAHAAGVAVLYLHALNPWGFSFGRRVTAENVDLNRNFQDFSKPLPINERYRELHALLLPEQWPPDAANQAALDAYLAEHGAAALQAAVSGGQHECADGLFFGGHAPAWSNGTLRAVLREQLVDGAIAKLGWIDIHTGLGPSGIGERIFAGRAADTAARARARSAGGDSSKA